MTRLSGITDRFVIITSITGWADEIEIPEFGIFQFAAVCIFAGRRPPMAPLFAFIALYRADSAGEFCRADAAVENPVLSSPTLCRVGPGLRSRIGLNSGSD